MVPRGAPFFILLIVQMSQGILALLLVVQSPLLQQRLRFKSPVFRKFHRQFHLRYFLQMLPHLLQLKSRCSFRFLRELALVHQGQGQQLVRAHRLVLKDALVGQEYSEALPLFFGAKVTLIVNGVFDVVLPVVAESNSD